MVLVLRTERSGVRPNRGAIQDARSTPRRGAGHEWRSGDWFIRSNNRLR